MKKSLIILLVLAFFCVNAFAADLDWSSMSDDEISAIIAAGQAELASRNPAPTGDALHMTKDTVLLDRDGILVTLTGKVETMGSLIQMEVIIENNSSDPIYLNVTGSSINGWEVFGAGVADIGAGKKKKGDLMFTLEDAEIDNPEQIEELELTLSVANADTWNTIFTADTLTLVP